jgi:hypothetical protein
MTRSGSQSGSNNDQLYNTLTMAVLAVTVLVIIFYIAAFVSPSLTPFAKTEPSLIAVMDTPTPKPTIAITPTATPLPPTFTPEPTRTTEPTFTPLPTQPSRTPRPTVFFTPIPTETGTPTPTTHPYPFKLVDEGVQYIRYPFSSDCSWLGIAGEVVDQEGEAVNGLPVVLNGGGLQNVVTTSGDRSDYGPGGWEHFLDSKVKVGNFTIQLYRVVGDRSFPISELVEVNTRADCRANLAYLVFELVWEDYNLP